MRPLRNPNIVSPKRLLDLARIPQSPTFHRGSGGAIKRAASLPGISDPWAGSQFFWLTLFVALILGLAGCMKAVEKKIAVPPPERKGKVELKGPYDSSIQKEQRDALRTMESDDWRIPQIFLAVAGRFGSEGDEEKALHFFDRAAGAFTGMKDHSGEALAFSRKFFILRQMGRENEALDLLREGNEKWKKTPLRAFPAYLDGRHALLRGDFGLARKILQRSLEDNRDYAKDLHRLWLRRDTELAAGMAAVLSDHVPRLQARHGVHGLQGSKMSPAGESRARLREALAINRELKQTRIGPFISAVDFQRTEAAACAFIGLDEGMRGDKAISFLYLHYALELARAAGDREGEIWSLLFLGELGLGADGHAEGLRAAETLKEKTDFYRAEPYRIWARLLLARYDLEQGRRNEAIGALQEADAILSIRGSAVEGEMLGEVFRIQRRAVYELLVELLAKEGHAEDAFRAAETAKALMVADLLSGRDIGGTPVVQDLLKREAELGETSRTLRRRILHISGDAQTGALLELLKVAEAAQRELFGRLEAEGEKFFPLVALRGIEPSDLQRLLDEDTTLFAYFTTDQHLYVWAIHRSAVHLERIDIPRTELRTFVFSYLDAVRSKNRRRIETLSRRAYDLLLKQIVPFVSGERIGFIPDDCLGYFPFAAMNYRGKFLVEGFSIFHLPLAGMLRQAMEGKAGSGLRILAFGDPDLEDETLDLHRAPDELRAVKKRIGQTTVLLNKQASEAKVGELSADYDILHFAVRVRFHPDAPLQSSLLLTPGAGQDGALSALEIFRLRFSGRAVVLSGCDTQPEKDPEGRSVAALQRAFLSAGSPSVVSTLWLVDDRAAPRLMDLFYRQVERKKSLSDSLRAAQLQMLREGAPPYVWAAFILTGKY
ncbi:MAG: CHAT domain-containing protein [Deltaproteobacteria bacterium]|nr:CHAT domain-containing protein [Deltaproteobacteria bacterium]